MRHLEFINKTIETILYIYSLSFASKKKRALILFFRSEPDFNSFCNAKAVKIWLAP